jgi:hypothetical protein
MADTQILIQFKNSLVSFIDELIDAFPNEPDLIILRIFLKDQISIEDVMNKFITIINQDNQKIKNYIKDRNESVFLENDIFQSISKAKALNFQKLWQSDSLDEDERNTIWRWIDSFVLLSDRYAKFKSLIF